ncbi:unannotated protein [freshwater metagenome]|uniref:Unannotated protein n=1 Tax=freshwater metagenome TaxID=449393 RepID=A0A6J7NBY0_9ZZZZ
MPQLHELDVHSSLVLVLGQVLPKFRCELVEVFIDAVDTAVLIDQFRSGLLAHAGNAREIVRRIAAQRGVMHIIGRLYARALENACFVIQRVIRNTALVIQNFDVRIVHKLIAVAIAGDDNDIVAADFSRCRQRGDDVVGFKPHKVEHRDMQDLDDLANNAHLLTK